MIEARTPRRWRARLAVVTVVAGLFTTGVVATAPAVSASSVTKAQPPKVAQLGKYAVGLRTETFVDSTRPTEIRGVPIAEGDKVVMWYPAANRDAEVFADPDRFDVGRDPNPHLAFGIGQCGVRLLRDG